MKKSFVPWLLVGAFVISACGGAVVGADTEPETTAPAEEPTAATEPSNSSSDDGTSGEGLLPVQEIPVQLESVARAWSTDFTRATVDLNELLVGIPASDPRDMIPPIDNPVFIHVSEADWLTDRDPGLAVEIDGTARFYPLAVLTRHEIVNDEFGEVPVAVTYCPLCNTGIAFDRRFDRKVLRLGVSGLLRNSDLVMWDNESQTLWQQITGEGIVGKYAGERLTPIASAIVRFADFADTYPDGEAMADNQGFGRAYGRNPYAFYSSREQPYAFFQGEIDDRFPALERVVGVTLGETSKAYPFSIIKEVRAVNDSIDGDPIAVFWGAPDTADALDRSEIAESQGIGTAVAYSAVVDGRPLSFSPLNDTEFFDLETGTTWSLLGKAIDGELAGSELELLPHRNEFWFAWHAFFPDAEVWEG